jgi:hypothetical protein
LQKVKKGKETKPKEKKSQYPEKKNQSSLEVNEGPAKSTEATDPQLHDPRTFEIPDSILNPTISKNPAKSQDEHITLSTESGGESNGEPLNQVAFMGCQKGHREEGNLRKRKEKKNPTGT